jgi:hypothetical protein
MKILRVAGWVWVWLAIPLALGWCQGAASQGSALSVFSVNPSSGADLVTQANSLIRECAGRCEIHIPCGHYAVSSGTITITNPGASIVGDGRSCVFIDYAGPNFLKRSSSAEMFFLPAAKIAGFTLTCSSSSSQCIEAGDVTGFDLEDVSLVGPAGATNAHFRLAGSSQGMVFQNSRQWMERALIRNVHIGGFATNIHFAAPTGTGTQSFGYWQVSGLWSNLGSNTAVPPACGNTRGAQSYGMAVDAGAAVYNVIEWTGSFNSECTTAADEYFRIAGTFQGVGFEIAGENSGAAVTFAHVVGQTGEFQFQGGYNVFGGGVAVDAIHYPNALPAFWVRPTAGLAGVNGGVKGAGSIANWNGSGQPVVITPSEYLENSNPAVPAFVGYVERPDGASSPLPVYDSRMSYCIGTIAPYAAPTNVQATWCVDGRGNESIKGDATATGKVTAAGFAAGGVAGFTGTKRVGSCTLDIKGGIITSVSGC